YSFGNLPEGLFQAAVDPATLASNLSPNGGGPASPFDVTLTAPGQSFAGADFGYVGSASFQGTAFYDVNGDGVQQPSEPGLGGTDFGYRGTSSVGNFVWQDLNGNGRQDPGEPGLDGVTVRLLDANGNVLETTTTANGGQYSFDGLAAGTYSLQFVAPAGYA